MPTRNWAETSFADKQAFLRYSRRKFAQKNQTRRDRNFHRKSTLRTTLKQAEAAIASSDAQQAQELYRQAASLLDKAAQKGVIKKGVANRNKSRLALKINQIV